MARNPLFMASYLGYFRPGSFWRDKIPTWAARTNWCGRLGRDSIGLFSRYDNRSALRFLFSRAVGDDRAIKRTEVAVHGNTR